MAQASFEDMRTELLGILEAQAPSHGIDIVDVEVVGTTKAPTVRVRIDNTENEKDDGGGETITLDEVSAQTGWISDLVDEADPIEGRFTLEVSSPGMARPLRKERDFLRFAGNIVSLTLRATEGRRRYTGKLEGIKDGMVSITTDEGPFSFTLEDIRSCSIKPSFDDLKPKQERAGGRKNAR